MFLARRRIHGEIGEHLKHVVLKHVADGPGLVVEFAAVLHAEILRHGDLDAADMIAVPDRLEHGIGKASIEDVLHRLLAEEVIDAEDVVFRKVPVQELVQFPRGGEVVAKWLFDTTRALAAQPDLASPSTTVANMLGGTAR